MPTRLALAALLVLVATPDAAHAQLGALRRKLEQQVQKSVLGEAPAQANAPANAAPVFNDRVLEVNDARIDQLLAGLKAEAAHAERATRAQAATAAQAKEWEARNEAHSRCVEPYKNELLKETGRMMGLALAAKREEAKAGAVGPTLRDSITAVTRRMEQTSKALEAKCGAGPGPSPYDTMGDDGDASADGAKAAGMTADQYAVLRERAAAFVRSRKGSTGRYAFTAGEREVLGRRTGDLAAFDRLLGS